MNKRKDKKIKKDNKDIVTIIMLIGLCLEVGSLILSYIFSLFKRLNTLINFKDYFLILAIIFAFINAILLIIIIISSYKENNNIDYNDYVYVSKEDLKNYQKSYNNRKKTLKK